MLTIFSSLAGGLRRKKHRGAKRISTIPMIVMSHGNPMALAMAPPAEGPCADKNPFLEIAQTQNLQQSL